MFATAYGDYILELIGELDKYSVKTPAVSYDQIKNPEILSWLKELSH
jgi:hypothetical protein